MRTLAGAGVSDARVLFNFQKMHSALGGTPSLDEVGGSALYLLSDLSTAVTGEIHYVDPGTTSWPCRAQETISETGEGWRSSLETDSVRIGAREPKAAE